MTSAELYEQLLTLATEQRDVVESGFRRLAEKVESLERRLDAAGGGDDAPVPLLMRIEETVRRIDERLAAGEEPAAIAQDMKSLITGFERLKRNVEILETVVARGAQLQFPWFHIKGDRNGRKCEAVTKVWKYLKEHEDSTRTEAVRETFRADPLGYRTEEALLSECRRLKVEKYRWC